MATAEQWRDATITIDRALGEHVFGIMLAALANKTYPFSRAAGQLPQKAENLPQSLAWKSTEHAMFLFLLCLWMRGGIKSDFAGRALGKLHELDPRWFHASWARHQPPDQLLKLLQRIGIGGLSQTNSRFWIENCARLDDRFGGDPVNILRGVTSYNEACARIKNHNGAGFKGFQEKMVSMLIYFLVDTGFDGIEDFMFPVPVDIHVFRILFAHEIVKVEGLPFPTNFYEPRVLEPIRAFMMEYCTLHNVNPIALADTLWIWSRTLCSVSPGNQVTLEDKRRGRKTEIIHDPVDWTKKSAREAFYRSCGSCAVRQTCKHDMPAGFHYIHGCSCPRRLRTEPALGLFESFVTLEGTTDAPLPPPIETAVPQELLAGSPEDVPWVQHPLCETPALIVPPKS